MNRPHLFNFPHLKQTACPIGLAFRFVRRAGASPAMTGRRDRDMQVTGMSWRTS